MVAKAGENESRWQLNEPTTTLERRKVGGEQLTEQFFEPFDIELTQQPEAAVFGVDGLIKKSCRKLTLFLGFAAD